MSWWRGRADARRGRARRVARCCANRRLAVLMLALVLVPLAASALGTDVAAGRRKALQCQACHGLDGLSKLPEAPHLAGQPERYLVKSIDEFRKGMRRNEMMTVAVKDLSDQDVTDLAAYYAAIEITAQPPPPRQ